PLRLCGEKSIPFDWFALAVMLAITATLLTLALAAPPGWSIDIGSGGDLPNLSGFFFAEQSEGVTFRWIDGHAQVLVVGPSPGRLELRLQGYAPAGPAPQLQFAREGQPLARFSVPPGWRRYRLLLPSLDPALAAGLTRLDFNATTTLAPDHRALGVAFDW